MRLVLLARNMEVSDGYTWYAESGQMGGLAAHGLSLKKGFDVRK